MLKFFKQYQAMVYPQNGEKLRISRGGHCIKQCFSIITSLFIMGTSLKGKNLIAPRVSEFFPLRAVP